MAGRPIKKRLDFSNWSVDMFDSDTKIDDLLDAQSWTGFGIYFYLCQKAYGSEGYYYRWSYANAASTARKMGGGVGSETVRQTVGSCLQIGLFDKRLFDREGVLTSRGIQLRYWIAVSERPRKLIIPELWLLTEEEAPGSNMFMINSDISTVNGNLSPINDHLSDQKESIEKRRKAKDSPPPQAEVASNTVPGKKKAARKTDLTGKEMERFERFWAVWPNKKSRGQAETTWKKIAPDDGVTDEIIAGVERAMQHDYRFRGNGQYTPHPSTWLNAKGWKDEYDKASGKNNYEGSWY